VQQYSSKHGIIQTGRSKDGGRAVSLYLANIRHIHNEAKKEFNDEDMGIIRIPQSPFKKYRVKRSPKAKKRAVSTKVIQAIIDLPDIEKLQGAPACFARRDLARDCFLLSFSLAGMNAADLYDCPVQNFAPDESVIIYNRKKTRTRRNDEAEMHIRIEPCIAPLVDRYRDPSGERLFCFHRLYSSIDTFNNALQCGLRDVEKTIESKHFTFYSGRHSYATISRSKILNIDKYTIHEGLNHVEPEMKVTDDYIERDYGNIWDANVKLLALFDWSGLERREREK
jgi:integrase